MPQLHIVIPADGPSVFRKHLVGGRPGSGRLEAARTLAVDVIEVSFDFAQE